MDNIREWIPETIRALREESGLSQTELADRCGFKSSGTISHFETGIRTPSIDSLDKLFAALGVDLTISMTPQKSFENEWVWVRRSVFRRLRAVVAELPDDKQVDDGRCTDPNCMYPH